MKQLLLTVRDKARVDELKEYGNITYVSEYTSLVGFECHKDQVSYLIQHPLVETWEDACTGNLQ